MNTLFLHIRLIKSILTGHSDLRCQPPVEFCVLTVRVFSFRYVTLVPRAWDHNRNCLLLRVLIKKFSDDTGIIRHRLVEKGPLRRRIDWIFGGRTSL